MFKCSVCDWHEQDHDCVMVLKAELEQRRVNWNVLAVVVVTFLRATVAAITTPGMMSCGQRSNG